MNGNCILFLEEIKWNKASQVLLCICWEQGHGRAGSEWFNLLLLRCYGEAGIANAILPPTSQKEIAKLGKDTAKSHSKDLRAGKCVLWCEIYRVNLFG